MFAASQSPTMEAAFGRPHKGGRAASGGAPTFVDSIVGDGEAANIAKTYAYTYQVCPYFHICHLSYYLLSFYISDNLNKNTKQHLEDTFERIKHS